jgi:hypothetical protein
MPKLYFLYPFLVLSGLNQLGHSFSWKIKLPTFPKTELLETGARIKEEA